MESNSKPLVSAVLFDSCINIILLNYPKHSVGKIVLYFVMWDIYVVHVHIAYIMIRILHINSFSMHMTLFPFSLLREYRGEYISNKYLQKKYIEHSIEKEALLQELAEAVEANDIKQLLQVYAEGADLSAPLPGYSEDITALHLAVELEDLTSLHIVDFLLGNG